MTNETPSSSQIHSTHPVLPIVNTGDVTHSEIPGGPGKSTPFHFRETSAAENSLDDQLVHQTKNQIRALVQEISDLAKSDCSRESFFEGFLTRTASALASVGGAIWIRDSVDGPLQLHYQINLKETSLAEDQAAQVQHSLLLNKLVESAEPTLVAPQSGGSAGDDNAGNPTKYLLVVGPLQIDQQIIGLVEIFQRPGAGPTTQRGYLRFLQQMCDIASEYLSNHQIRSFADQQAMWQQLEQFIRAVHQGLDTEQTTYTIANEARRLLECDRVSVAIAHGRRMRICSVSGLDSIERRAEQVKQLGALATRVCRAGEPLWYEGDDTDLPPQIEKRLHDYVDKSHTKMLAIIPLNKVHTDDESKSRSSSGGKLLGALIVEQLKDARVSPTLEKRVEIVVQHSQTALTNSVEHNAIFLLPLWRALGHLTSLFRGGNLAKTLGGLSLVALAVFSMCWFPYPFSLSANGVLKPQIQHEVFAQVDGVLEEILIPDGYGAIVEEGQKLAGMSNNDLRVEIENLEGEINRTRKQMDAIQFSRVEDMDRIDEITLSGEFAKAAEEEKSLRRRLEIKLSQAAQLEIRSPARGRVVNWQVRQNLLRRPVNRGQNLLTIVDPDTQWEIELEMPERRVSHLLKAQRRSSEQLEVTFALVSHPGTEFSGRLVSVDQKLEVHSDDGNSARLRIAFDNSQMAKDLLRSGTRVTAKVRCGERPIGYVVFHELIETVQSSVMLWF